MRLALDTGTRLFWPSLALIALTIKFFSEILHVLPNIFSIAEADLILDFCCRTGKDMTLVGGLLVMVMFSALRRILSPSLISTRVKKS